MTPEQISSLTDAELNRACAEHVMRWEYVHNPGAVKYWRWSEGVINVCNWSPATSLAHAEQATEKMRAGGWCFSIVLGEGFVRCSAWRFVGEEYQQIDEIVRDTEARAKTETCLRARIKESE